jgi:hypothetical protein
VCTRVVSSFCYRPTCTTNNNKNLPLLSVIHKYLSIPDPDLNRLRAQKRPAINIFDPFLPHCEKFSASCKREKKSVHRIMENELIRIPKLKGIENWAVWKFQTRVILQSSDAWSIVDGSSAIPVQGQTIDETTFNRTLAAWKKNDSIAQRIIATTVEEKPLLHILNCKSAKDMWDKLIQVYEQKCETSIHMLMQQWYNLQMKSDDDISMLPDSRIWLIGWKLWVRKFLLRCLSPNY